MKIKEHSNNFINTHSKIPNKRLLSIETKNSKTDKSKKSKKIKNENLHNKKKNFSKKSNFDLSESIPTNCSSDKLKIIIKNIEKRKNPKNQDYKIFLKKKKIFQKKKKNIFHL